MYKYPPIKKLTNKSLLWNKNAHFIESYEPEVSLFVKLGEGVDVNITLLDCFGNILDNFSKTIAKAIEINEAFIPYASNIGILQYQLFFDKSLKIVDFVGPNLHFATPGMLKDLFRENFSIQKTIGFGLVNSVSIEELKNTTLSSVIIKPTTNVYVANKLVPLYARI